MSAAVIASHYVVSGGGPAIVSDTFNRADNATSLGTADVGGAWTALAGVWGISSNTARVQSGGSQQFATIDAGVADCTVQATIASGVGSGGGVAFRFTDASNGFFTEADSANGYLYKVVAGGYSIIATYSVWTAADVIAVVLSGSSIIVKRNGVQVASVTDAHNQTATKHGLRDYGGAIRLDDFSVT